MRRQLVRELPNPRHGGEGIHGQVGDDEIVENTRLVFHTHTPRSCVPPEGFAGQEGKGIFVALGRLHCTLVRL